MTLNKYIPPKNLHTPLPQKAMANESGNVLSQNTLFTTNQFGANIRTFGSITGYFYFVDATNGSDLNNGLKVSTAFKTIKKAVDSLPTDLGGLEVFIFVLPGTYTAVAGQSVAEIRKTNGRINLMWAGAWLSNGATAFNCAWAATMIPECIDVPLTSNDQVILEGYNTTPLIVNGTNLIFDLSAQDYSITTWNLRYFAHRWKFQTHASSTNVAQLGLFQNLLQCFLLAVPELDMARVTDRGFTFQTCAYVKFWGAKVRSTVLSTAQGATGVYSGVLHCSNSPLDVQYSSGYWKASLVAGDVPADVNNPFDIEGMRTVFAVGGNAGNYTNDLANMVKYAQGLLPDANLPYTRIGADVYNFNYGYHEDKALFTLSSTLNGVTRDIKNSITTNYLNSKIKLVGDNLIHSVTTTAPADALLIAKNITTWLNETLHKLTFKVKYNDGTTVKSGVVDLVAPLEYTALLSETGYAATSGLLIAGQTYYIASYVAGDDFTNVGGTNVTGNTFVASGTTPTTWTNSSILVSVGISAPAVTLLTNGLSAAIVWTYSAVGTYIGTLTGAFTENKTVFQYPPLGDDKAVTVEWTSANVITVKTYETGALKDGLLVKFPLTIKVYP